MMPLLLEQETILFGLAGNTQLFRKKNKPDLQKFSPKPYDLTVLRNN